MNPLWRNILAQFPQSPVGASTTKCPATVTLISIRFTSDHGMLTDKFSLSTSKTADLDRWIPGGTSFKALHPKEWVHFPFHSFPISHTKNKKIQIVAELEVRPQTTRPGPGTLTIDGGAGYVRFSGKAMLFPTNQTKTNTVKIKLTAKDPLPDKVQKLTHVFTWRVEFCGQQFTGMSGPHIIYVTYGTPAPHDDDPDSEAAEPLGVTMKRMETAVRLVEPGDTTKPPEYEIPEVPPSPAKTIQLNREQNIIRHLISQFRAYTLKPDDSLSAFAHPNFLNKPTGGAWPLDDFRQESGECQAMVRFVRDVLKLLGIPGTAEVTHVYADPNAPYPARESLVGHDYGWEFQANGNPLEKDLADQPLTAADIGTTYPQDGPPGFNQFEACLKYTYPPGSRPLYFPGGEINLICETIDQVLKLSFDNFVETERITNPNDGKTDYKLTKILVTYTRNP